MRFSYCGAASFALICLRKVWRASVDVTGVVSGIAVLPAVADCAIAHRARQTATRSLRQAGYGCERADVQRSRPAWDCMVLCVQVEAATGERIFIGSGGNGVKRACFRCSNVHYIHQPGARPAFRISIFQDARTVRRTLPSMRRMRN